MCQGCSEECIMPSLTPPPPQPKECKDLNDQSSDCSCRLSAPDVRHLETFVTQSSSPPACEFSASTTPTPHTPIPTTTSEHESPRENYGDLFDPSAAPNPTAARAQKNIAQAYALKDYGHALKEYYHWLWEMALACPATLLHF
jgi:hypothetical protein